MATEDLNIRMRLLDEASRGLQAAANRFREFGENLNKIGSSLSKLGSRFTFLGAAVTGAFSLAMKNAMEFSPAVNKVMREIGNSFEQLNFQVAQSLLPVFQQLGNALSNVVAWFKALDPHLRDQIIQWAMIGGAVMMFGGIALKVIGTVISIIGKLIMGLNPVTIALIAISAAVVMMIKYWDKVKTVVLPIITLFELGVKTIEWAVLKVIDTMLLMVEKFALVTDTLKVLVTVLEKLGQIPKGIADTMRTALDGVKQNVTTMRQAVQEQMKRVEADLVKAATTGRGAWAENVDGMVMNLQEFIGKIPQFFKVGTDSAKMELAKLGNFASKIAQDMASAMERALGNFFYQGLTGQLTDARQAFAEFGQSILQILTQALAKLILFYTIGRALQGVIGFNPVQFHQGGVVKRAHSGAALSSDEVPIIAQSGEGIISRKGMNAMGKGNFDRLNRGDGSGGASAPVIVIHQPIQTYDTRDYMRNRKQIAGALMEELRNNGEFKKAIVQYT